MSDAPKGCMTSLKTKLLDEPRNSGGYAVRETVRFAFFMRRPHLRLVAAVVDAFGQSIDLFPPPALSMFAGASGDWFDYDAAGLKQQVAERLSGKQAFNGAASLSGDQANIPDFTVDYHGFGIDRPIFRQRASHFVLSIAASSFNADVRAASLQLARRLAATLDCSAAYVSVALEGNRTRCEALARRYQCMDISDVGCVAADLADRMPGVYWINFLGRDLVATLGGRATVESGLSGSANVEELEGGILAISLGEEPDLGDVNQRPKLADWNYLAALAYRRQVLHVPKKVKYFDADTYESAMEDQERWHLRFVGV
jgi:hypothetical protein